MVDPRVQELASKIVSYSVELTPNDCVLLQAFDIADEITAEFIKTIQRTGAKFVTRLESEKVNRQKLLGMNEANAQLIADIEKYEMEKMTAYIALRGSNNVAEQSDIPPEIMAMWQRIYTVPVVFETRVAKTKWVVLRWPTPSMAQQAGMSTQAFEDFFFKVCNLDYSKMEKACEPLKELMDKTDVVRLVGPGTDLTFSIRDIGCVPCVGKRNVPDGECFSCPVKDSVNGVIQFNTVSIYRGIEFKNIRYVVKNGKIIEASADGLTKEINEILDTDEGARYFGEWSLGFNPYILHPMKDTLFDEKIAGSFHLTPGNAYEGRGGNGNKSAVHWDTVMIQRQEYGGGEVWFDGTLIRKNGIFVLPQLEALNPENLVEQSSIPIPA